MRQVSELAEEGRRKYQDQSDKDKLRYNAQLAEICENGFFIMEDGQKSCDVAPVEKKKKKGKKSDDLEDNDAEAKLQEAVRKRGKKAIITPLKDTKKSQK